MYQVSRSELPTSSPAPGVAAAGEEGAPLSEGRAAASVRGVSCNEGPRLQLTQVLICAALCTSNRVAHTNFELVHCALVPRATPVCSQFE